MGQEEDRTKSRHRTPKPEPMGTAKDAFERDEEALSNAGRMRGNGPADREISPKRSWGCQTIGEEEKCALEREGGRNPTGQVGDRIEEVGSSRTSPKRPKSDQGMGRYGPNSGGGGSVEIHLAKVVT